MRKLEGRQHIVVGTPGRVYDMISRKVLRTQDILLSATMPTDVLDVTTRFMRKPVKNSREERGVDPRWYQAVLHLCGEGRVEVGHVVRSLRDPDYHAGRHFLQHPKEGRLVDRENAQQRFYRFRHARRYGPEGARCYYARIPLRLEPSIDHHRPFGQRHRRATSLPGHKLRPANQPRELHPQDRSRRKVW